MSNRRTTPHDKEDYGMLAEYDFSQGVRGKHAALFHRGYTRIIHRADGTTEVREVAPPAGAVVLDPDVRAYFPDSETVNRVLRELIRLVPQRPSGGRALIPSTQRGHISRRMGLRMAG
jgi:hypothetical protein